LRVKHAEQALWPDDQHEQQHDIGRRVLEAVGQGGAGIELDQADDDAADQRAGIEPKPPSTAAAKLSTRRRGPC